MLQKKQKKLTGTRGTIGVRINSGTTISSASSEIIDPASIDILPTSDTINTKANEYHSKKQKKRNNPKKGNGDAILNSEVFEFGIPGTHLIFSSPVTIIIDTPLYSDGVSIDLAVLHTGDSIFNTSGLSTSNDTLCNNDGSASKPGSQVRVKNGKITFYTCGASSFTFNPSGGTTGSNDLKLVIGDCAQVQLYYNNLTQIYTGNPPATGCSTG